MEMILAVLCGVLAATVVVQEMRVRKAARSFPRYPKMNEKRLAEMYRDMDVKMARLRETERAARELASSK